MKTNPSQLHKMTVAPYIKVTIRLRQKQQIDISHWRCTLHGELRNVTSDVVELYCVNIEDAIHSFKVEEIRDFKITGSYPDDDYARGAPCPWIY